MEAALSLEEILARKEAGIRELRTRRLELGKKLSRWVASTPDALEQGLAILRRRLKRSSCHARELNLQWMEILQSRSKEEVAELLLDPSEQSEQLRACAPFLPPGNHR